VRKRGKGMRGRGGREGRIKGRGGKEGGRKGKRVEWKEEGSEGGRKENKNFRAVKQTSQQ
jgi:hypothetical protein